MAKNEKNDSAAEPVKASEPVSVAEALKADAPAPTPAKPVRVTENFMQNVRKSTKELLDAQPKHTIRLPAAKKNDPNYEVVGVNGYNYQIKRGETVQVPETVFNILVEAELI